MVRAVNMRSLTHDLEAEFLGVTIWGIGDEEHKLRTSDHNEDDTAGSRAAQSDADTRPEHRAIDVKVDHFFTRLNAYDVINRILADPRLRARLRYINFESFQWAASSNWQRRDNGGDPHPGHVHFSGMAANDEDPSPWFVRASEGKIMFAQMGDKGTGVTAVLQSHINEVLEFMKLGTPLTVDDDYGPKTAAALLQIGCGNPANGGSRYWAGEYLALNEKLRSIAAAKAIAVHVAALAHGVVLPETFTFTMPTLLITAQTGAVTQ